MVAGKWAGVMWVGKNSLPVGTVEDIIGWTAHGL